MRRTTHSRWPAAALALAMPAMLACGSADPEEETGQYVLAFPSIASAIAVDGIQVFVFDAQQPGADCQSLIAVRQVATEGADVV